MTRKRSRRDKRVTRPDETQPINPYKPMTDQELQDEIDALSWVRPDFRVPELEEVLKGVEFEAAQMVRIFKL